MDKWAICQNMDVTDLSLSLFSVFVMICNEDDVYKVNSTYLVGGCVRDMLMGKKPKDFDIVTSVPIKRVNEILKEEGWSIDEVGNQFLVTVASKNGEQFEISNFRKESGFSDGRRPDQVDIGDLSSDAARRDFTVNSIYFNPLRGEWKDPNDGLKDLTERKLKFIGRPHDRIKEDYLRVFRFYRFLQKTGFTPDKKSLKACREMFNEAYSNTTPERVRVEIERMSKING